MAVPKRRQSSSRRDRRRANHRQLAGAQVENCSRCGEPKRPHYICSSCGYYKDREVLVVKEAAAATEE